MKLHVTNKFDRSFLGDGYDHDALIAFRHLLIIGLADARDSVGYKAFANQLFQGVEGTTNYILYLRLSQTMSLAQNHDHSTKRTQVEFFELF